MSDISDGVAALERLADHFCPTPTVYSDHWHVFIEWVDVNGAPTLVKYSHYTHNVDEAIREAVKICRNPDEGPRIIYRINNVWAVREEHTTHYDMYRFQTTPEFTVRD